MRSPRGWASMTARWSTFTSPSGSTRCARASRSSWKPSPTGNSTRPTSTSATVRTGNLRFRGLTIAREMADRNGRHGRCAMQRTQVESTMLRSVGYDPAVRVLELEFRNGRLYRYGEVEEETYRELMAAPSKGRYFLDHIDD